MDPTSLAVGAVAGAALLVLGLAASRASLLRRRDAVLEEARSSGEALMRDAEIRARDEELRRREELDRRDAVRQEEAERRERRLGEQEAAFDRRTERIEEREKELEVRGRALEEREADVETIRLEVEAQRRRARDELLELSGISRDEAVSRAMERLETELTEERADRVHRSVERAEEEADERARKILSRAVQRLAVSYTLDSTTSTVTLPNDAMKGRLIGREGRNIRTFEKLTGVDLIIDDTPSVVVVSCFDNVRREVARRALEVLVEDGRVHPGRIEEVVAQTRRAIDEDIRQTAKKVLHELEIARVDPRIEFCLGRLKYRTSYGQNQLAHAVEVAYLSAAIAAEMGIDAKLARRCGLFHDIGKAIDAELEGGHATIGADLARRCNERPEVVNAIAAHHSDVPFESIHGVVAQVADAISAARPGARRDTMEEYIDRLEKLERIAYSAIRPRRTFLSSLTHSSFSLSMPSGSWMNPEESESVIALPPRRFMFSTAYCATLPDPDTNAFFPYTLSWRVLSISSAKYTVPYPVDSGRITAPAPRQSLPGEDARELVRQLAVLAEQVADLAAPPHRYRRPARRCGRPGGGRALT